MNLINILLNEAVYLKQLNVEDAVAVASYPASGSFIGVRGAHRFGFIVSAGALNSALTFQVQQATAADGTPKDVTGAVVVVAADGDDKTYWIECGVDQLDGDNGYCYVSLKATGAAGGDDYAAIHFFKIGGSVIPVTQAAETIVNLVG